MLDEEHIDWEREKEMIQRRIWDPGEKNKAASSRDETIIQAGSLTPSQTKEKPSDC